MKRMEKRNEHDRESWNKNVKWCGMRPHTHKYTHHNFLFFHFHSFIPVFVIWAHSTNGWKWTVEMVKIYWYLYPLNGLKNMHNMMSNWMWCALMSVSAFSNVILFSSQTYTVVCDNKFPFHSFLYCLCAHIFESML